MMNIRQLIERLINNRNSGIILSIVLFPLTLFSFCYSAAVSIRNKLYTTAVFKQHSVSCRVISVGNITVGGTGKTPTVCFLCSLLKKQGLRVVVLNRGYLGKKAHGYIVVSAGAGLLASSEDAGDEAVMLAEKLPGIPVIAGSNRVAAAQIAVEKFNADVIILDDGFQYLKLDRNIDIVLINATNPFGNGFVLPRGNLRERITSLRRAQVILLTKSDTPQSEISHTEAMIAEVNPQADIFKSYYSAGILKAVRDDRIIQPEHLEGSQIIGLCSIGDPESFFSMLESLQISVLKRLVFEDHHKYHPDDYDLVNRWAQQGDYIITTEKDIAKLDKDMIQIDKLLCLEIIQVVKDEDLFISAVGNYL